MMTDEQCLSRLEEIEGPLQQLQVKSLFLVADAPAVQASGAAGILEPLLSRYRSHTFSRFEPNPKLSDAQAGLQEFIESGADAILAIGGGTALDIAKLIAIFARQSAEPAALVLGEAQFLEPSIPLIAVPTTAGTGSEATQFAVVYRDGVKYSVDHPSLMPRWCVLDPRLTASLPSRITAQTGLDAFCQAMESVWSVRSTAASRGVALEALRLAWTHLPTAVHQPTPDSRAGMSRAAHLAGRAINVTRTTAPHAISYAITSDHGVPHGQAVALTLGSILIHNDAVTDDDCLDARGVGFVREQMRAILDLLGCRSAPEAADRIRDFITQLGCETRLRDLGITSTSALQSIADKVNVARLVNNPRRLTGEQLLALLTSIA